MFALDSYLMSFLCGVDQSYVDYKIKSVLEVEVRRWHCRVRACTHCLDPSPSYK